MKWFLEKILKRKYFTNTVISNDGSLLLDEEGYWDKKGILHISKRGVLLKNTNWLTILREEVNTTEELLNFADNLWVQLKKDNYQLSDGERYCITLSITNDKYFE